MSSAAAQAPAKEMTVGEIAATVPGAIIIFEKYRIDYACGGKHPLAEVCRDAGLSYPEIAAEIRAAHLSTPAGPTWDQQPLPALVGHILDEYHGDLVRRLDGMRPAIQQLPEAVGTRLHFKLVLRRTLEHLAADLKNHERREEQTVFQALLDLPAGAPLPAPVRKAIRILEHEHESVSWVLEELRQLTNNYSTPDAAPYRVLYDNLMLLETRIRMHLHLENNVLFPRAMKAHYEN